MGWVFRFGGWVNLILVGVSLGFFIAWQRRRGKALLVTSIALLLAMMLSFRTINILANSGAFDGNHLIRQVLSSIAMLLGVVSHALLLAFAVVSRTSPSPEADLPAVGRGRLFSTRGRYNRARYFWTMFVISLCINIPTGISRVWLESAAGDIDIILPVFITVNLLFIVPGAVISALQVVKRLHDMNRPGTHYWLALIPLYNIYFGLILLTRKGTDGPNEYGPDPLAGG